MAHKNETNQSPYKARQERKGRPKGRSLSGQHKKPQVIYAENEANDRLYDIFKNHDFSEVDHELRLKLVQFYRLLMQNQEHENFTRLLKFRDIAIKHFIDCLIIARFTKLKFPLLDVGTGPGFPGIPLKFLYPNKKIILAEGVQKRVTFLKKVRDEMNLQELDIIGRNVSQDFVYPVQGVITRAVEDVSNTLTNVLYCLQTGGRVYLMKGPNVDPEIKMAKKNMSEFYKLVDDIHYTLPNTEHKRRLLIYEKIKAPEPRDLNDDED